MNLTSSRFPEHYGRGLRLRVSRQERSNLPIRAASGGQGVQPIPRKRRFPFPDLLILDQPAEKVNNGAAGSEKNSPGAVGDKYAEEGQNVESVENIQAVDNSGQVIQTRELARVLN
jgi:hypothetical protein